MVHVAVGASPGLSEVVIPLSSTNIVNMVIPPLRLMHQSNRSFSIPPGNPWVIPQAFEFLENFCSISPLNGPKSCSNAPTPGKITRLDWTGTSFLVLEVLLCYLHPSIIYSVPCD